MSLDNCPKCNKKLLPPFKSSGRQVCTGCDWSDRPKKDRNTEKKKSAKSTALMSFGRRRIVIGACLVIPLLLLAFYNKNVLSKKCAGTNWEISDLLNNSNLEIINLSKGSKPVKVFDCYSGGIFGDNRCSNGSSTVNLQNYRPALKEISNDCTEFIDQNENEYCLEYLETVSKVTYVDDSCTTMNTEVTSVFGLRESKTVPDPLIFHHTQTWIYEGSEYQQIEF